MIKRLFLAMSLMVLSLSCSAEEAPKAQQPVYEAGKHYQLISPPLRSMSGDKIEVAEFFWYGCGHCNTFEAMVEPWKKALPDDVTFRGIPAIWHKRMDLHARAYYVAEALGVLDVMHPVMFAAMNVDRKPLNSPEEVRELFVANGVSGDDFDKTLNSFGVNSQVSKGVAAAKNANVTGTPTMMVNGKYLVGTRGAGGQAQMLEVVDYLVEKERTAKK